MSIKEITNKRSLIFSNWLRPISQGGKGGVLHSCFGPLITNQDWIIYNYNNKTLILFEEKTHNAMLPDWQKNILKIIDNALKEYCPKNNIKYDGYHFIRFEKEGPQNGKIFWHENCNDEFKEITEKELKERLNSK